ncbi:MAG: Cell cycle checkpoint protein rad17 [Candelina submexicana]|nr:MAG: Cell cycle checkpoint protein rad17 [Candelina submexicana]
MVARSAKRGKKLTVHSSDDEDLREKRPKRGRNLSRTRPEKPEKKVKAAGKDQKPKPIYTFFKSVAEQEPGQHGDTEDLIDDSLDEDLLLLDGPTKSQPSVPAARPDRLSTASQIFVKSITKTKPEAQSSWKGTPALADGGIRPWVERFAPATIEELAVHKRKISDVREWLENALAARSRKALLVLRGPSGSGKTTTVSLLSQALNLDLLEWRNPMGSKSQFERSVSMSAHFEDFIARSRMYGELDLFGTSDEVERSRQERSNSTFDPARRRAILIEEFPNTFARTSDTLQSFRNTILQYLASNTSTSAAMSSSFTPLIMIISETLLNTTTAIADSFTAHRLLGPHILNHPGASVIDFNPVAGTFITKALELAIQKEARVSGRKQGPGAAVLKKLGEVGDVRSAVSSLEFLCLRGDESGDWGGKNLLPKTRKGKGSDELTAMERQSLEIITQREASLGIFHAVGKVVYNKREEDLAPSPGLVAPVEPPEHLTQHKRPKRSQVSVDNLFDETGTDTQTFIAALHENYLLSCDSLDSVDACVKALSETDLLSLSWDGGFRSSIMGGGAGRGNFHGVGNDNLRQSELSFQMAVRGILFNLPSPVSRRASTYNGHNTKPSHGSGGKGDAFRMLYPKSTRIWRQMQEIESIVELLSLRTANLDMSSQALGYGNYHLESVGVESWKRIDQGKFSADATHKGCEDERRCLSAIGGGSARREMILERLPYMAKIQCGASRPSASLSDIEKVALFRGTTCAEDGFLEDDDELTFTTQSALNPEEDRVIPPRKPLPAQHIMPEPNKQAGLRLPMNTVVQKLVLSDDDIEDD